MIWYDFFIIMAGVVVAGLVQAVLMILPVDEVLGHENPMPWRRPHSKVSSSRVSMVATVTVLSARKKLTVEVRMVMVKRSFMIDHHLFPCGFVDELHGLGYCCLCVICLLLCLVGC